MMSKLKARLREEWAEIGPFIVAGVLGLVLNILEALIFIGLPLFAVAFIVICVARFLKVCA